MKPITTILGFGILMPWLLACGAATSTDSSSSPDLSAFTPPDLSSTEETMGYQDVVLIDEDHRLAVPGETMGKIPPMKKRPKKFNVKDPSYWPQGDGIADMMEELVWGMSVRKVFSVFEAKIRATYNEQLKAQSGDLLAEDRIRTRMNSELNKVKNSYVVFDGRTTGYEAHMVNAEFTHHNSESMLVWDAGQYVEYLFFFKERFWKRVRLFRIDQLGGITLNDFVSSVQSLMGVSGQEIVTDEGEFDKIVWRDHDTYVAILDGSGFYGVYGLRLSAALAETNLSRLRTSAGRVDPNTVSSDVANTIERAVTTVDVSDPQSSVVDQYTGRPSTPSSEKPSTKPSGSEISKDELDTLF